MKFIKFGIFSLFLLFQIFVVSNAADLLCLEEHLKELNTVRVGQTVQLQTTLGNADETLAPNSITGEILSSNDTHIIIQTNTGTVSVPKNTIPIGGAPRVTSAPTNPAVNDLLTGDRITLSRSSNGEQISGEIVSTNNSDIVLRAEVVDVHGNRSYVNRTVPRADLDPSSLHYLPADARSPQAIRDDLRQRVLADYPAITSLPEPARTAAINAKVDDLYVQLFRRRVLDNPTGYSQTLDDHIFAAEITDRKPGNRILGGGGHTREAMDQYMGVVRKESPKAQVANPLTGIDNTTVRPRGSAVPESDIPDGFKGVPHYEVGNLAEDKIHIFTHSNGVQEAFVPISRANKKQRNQGIVIVDRADPNNKKFFVKTLFPNAWDRDTIRLRIANTIREGNLTRFDPNKPRQMWFEKTFDGITIRTVVSHDAKSGRIKLISAYPVL